MTARFNPDHLGIGEMLRSDMLARVVMATAIGIKDRAEASAPIGGPDDSHRGRYKESFEISLRRRGGATHDRVEAVVKNTSPEAMFVEWGNLGNEPYHTLLKAASEGRV